MSPSEISKLRSGLGLSRAALARFLGVAEITIMRWENGEETSPRGLALAVLTSLQNAASLHGTHVVATLVKTATLDHGRALKALFDMAYDTPGAAGVRSGGNRS